MQHFHIFCSAGSAAMAASLLSAMPLFCDFGQLAGVQVLHVMTANGAEKLGYKEVQSMKTQYVTLFSGVMFLKHCLAIAFTCLPSEG